MMTKKKRRKLSFEKFNHDLKHSSFIFFRGSNEKNKTLMKNFLERPSGLQPLKDMSSWPLLVTDQPYHTRLTTNLVDERSKRRLSHIKFKYVPWVLLELLQDPILRNLLTCMYQLRSFTDEQLAK